MPSTGRATVPFVPYLEGMRGVAALYVVLFHVRILLEANYVPFGPTADLLPFRGQFLLYGHYAVGVFIVISGFVLTLPVAVRGALAGGPRGFLRRRARRLLPGYYAALVLAVPLTLLRDRLEHAPVIVTNLVAQFAAHVVLLHDLNEHTIWAIDSPLWSVALEVQIYVAFVVLLLPVMRRFGLAATIAIAFALGYLPTAYGLARHLQPLPLAKACFWFLGLFALGSAAAYVAYDKDDRFASLRERVPWKAVSLAAGGAFLWLVLPLYTDPHDLSYRVDPFLGLCVATGFVAIAKDQRAGRRSIVATVFGWKPLIVLGSFSYSLYLIHDPVVVPAMDALAGAPPSSRLLVGFGVLVPALVAAAYAFARVFEFPFVSSARRDGDREASASRGRSDGQPAAPLSLAP